MNFKKILIAVDNSTCAEKAAKAGYEMATKFDAKVALVNIIEPVPLTATPEMTMAPAFMEMYENSKENSALLLQEMQKKYSKGIETKLITLIDTATHGIIEEAEKWGAHLIVIGTHGRTGFSHFLMGSVAEHVTRKSACPVLIVPNRES